MRYFTLTYLKQADGKINEIANTLNKLKDRDRIDCNVILDFRDERVLKCTVNGQGLSVDWLTVIDYFSKYYGETFEQLVKANNEVAN